MVGCVEVTVGKEVAFEILTAGAGPGQAKVSINSPSGKPVPALTTAKPPAQGVVGFNSKFIPHEKGVHSVQVTYADQSVPRSPFSVTAAEVLQRAWCAVTAVWGTLATNGKVKGKVFPYSLPSVGPGADPGVQAVSPQVT